MDISEYVKVAGLPIGYMQFVEIAREIDKTGIKLLVFDEPTAVLTESEAERLLAIMRQIANRGIAIIFITHRLDEVMAVADSLTVLRDGEFVARREVKDTSVVEIAELMIGRKVEKLVDESEDTRQLSDTDIALSCGISTWICRGNGSKGSTWISAKGRSSASAAGRPGEDRHPQWDHGPVPRPGGGVRLWGAIEPEQAGRSLSHGIAFVSEDRRGVGLLLGESIEQNIVFSALQIKGDFLGPLKLLNQHKAKQHALDMIKLLDIRCTGPHQAAGSLSGGNQQKVCLARALTINPKILIVSEPTRGIDIGAKKLVLEHLVKINREQGITIVMVSSELVELRSLCDRIAIVSDGKLARIMRPDDSDAEFGLAMAGSRKAGA